MRVLDLVVAVQLVHQHTAVMAHGAAEPVSPVTFVGAFFGASVDRRLCLVDQQAAEFAQQDMTVEPDGDKPVDIRVSLPGVAGMLGQQDVQAIWASGSGRASGNPVRCSRAGVILRLV